MAEGLPVEWLRLNVVSVFIYAFHFTKLVE